METQNLKDLFRKFQNGDAPPQGELDGIHYEIKVIQSGKIDHNLVK